MMEKPDVPDKKRPNRFHWKPTLVLSAIGFAIFNSVVFYCLLAISFGSVNLGLLVNELVINACRALLSPYWFFRELIGSVPGLDSFNEPLGFFFACILEAVVLTAGIWWAGKKRRG